jgi:hypothetical protein
MLTLGAFSYRFPSYVIDNYAESFDHEESEGVADIIETRGITNGSRP